jgi:N-acetylglucosaminyldiphosphoundecaprenol N-acetyl-beta-D-mannosaminyltransferase
MRVPVGNVEFDNVTMAEAVNWIVEMAKKPDQTRLVCTGNLDHLVILDRDPEFAKVYREADLVLADGAPVLWVSRLAASAAVGPLTERVAGSDMFWELVQASAVHGLRIFFLGGKTGAADRAAEVVRERLPKATICGAYCPPFETFSTDEEQENIRRAIAASSPDILMVAFGAPKQEKWIAANKALINVPVAIGVGGTFEMIGGNVRRAPVWMRKTGLEWSFRFAQEPSRLFRRYFIDDIPFLIKLVWRTLVVRVTRKAYRPSVG